MAHPLPPKPGTRTFSTAVRWRALGTRAELAVTSPDLLQDATRLAADLLDRVDRACSRFRPDSDLARANAAAGHWVRVDPLLTRAAGAAVRAAEVTNGLVDPTLGRPMAAIGYDRTLDDVLADRIDPASVRLPPAPPRPGAWREIGIDPAGELRVPPGTALDLGATGKGFAADLVAAELAQRLGCGIVVSLGGDVAVAGEPPVTQDGVGWPVDVGDWSVDVGDSSVDAGDGPSGRQTVLLDSGGLATSSTRRRVWRHGGLLVHHLLDPVTGRPVPMIWNEVSVRAPTCLDANAATTACMVLGESAPIWLRRDRMPGRLVGRDGCLVLTAGWPPA